jgi:Undecaprenyl-phosphate galactose phosphotransferase WbaP
LSVLQPNPIPQLAARPRSALAFRAAREAVSRPWLARATLLTGDLAALVLAAAASVLVRHHSDPRLVPQAYLHLWPVLLLFPLAYAAAGLYPGFGRNPVDELRKLCVATSVVYPALAVTVFLLKDAVDYSRGVFLLAWMHTLLLVPLGRAAVRFACARKPWWGYPVVIVGSGKAAAAIWTTLERQPELGLRPVGVFDDPQLAAPAAREFNVRHVILAMAEIPQRRALLFFQRCSELFADIIVVPDLAGFSSLWVEARDLSGILGLEIQQRLLRRTSRCVKRALDLLLIAAAAIPALPLFGSIAAWIKLTSPGPLFYGQLRYGQRGEPFTAWKFRSMVTNASEALEECLASDPALRQEWLRDHKLRVDPRVTRAGRWLRQTSLDELPQLWNVLRGQMSLVGPRPIVASEIPRYGDGFELYKKVTPGLTGLWQVSGRNNLSYEQRVGFDLYYVRNWSVWLDLHILARTVKVVLRGDGAY